MLYTYSTITKDGKKDHLTQTTLWRFNLKKKRRKGRLYKYKRKFLTRQSHAVTRVCLSSGFNKYSRLTASPRGKINKVYDTHLQLLSFHSSLKNVMFQIILLLMKYALNQHSNKHSNLIITRGQVLALNQRLCRGQQTSFKLHHLINIHIVAKPVWITNASIVEMIKGILALLLLN